MVNLDRASIVDSPGNRDKVNTAASLVSRADRPGSSSPRRAVKASTRTRKKTTRIETVSVVLPSFCLSER